MSFKTRMAGVGLATTFFSTTALADTCPGLEVVASGLNVRTGPSTGYQKVDVIHYGEQYVTTGETSGNWAQIWFNQYKRWVYTGSYATEKEVSCGKVTTSVLNVRSGPSTGYRIVGTTSKDDIWAVIDQSGNWRKIWYASESRWVHGSYLNQDNVNPPAIELTSFEINEGEANTTSRFVNLYSTYDYSTPAYYSVSENPSFSDSNWTAYQNSVSHTLSDGEGVKTLYLQVKNDQGYLSNQLSASIDYHPPIQVGFNIDRDEFYRQLRAYFGSLTQSQVDGINELLVNIEADDRPAINNQTVWMRQIAYMFSTTKHEVANTYHPITEYSNTHCVNYDGGCTFKGRGYVQLTHLYNYDRMSPIVSEDLVSFPELALNPDIAYVVMSHGMHYGMFTGHKLGSYVKSGLTDYYNARKVVNGLDRAGLLQGYAESFQAILESATLSR